MTLRAEFGLARGTARLDVALHVEQGRTVALVGPNGAGKSTLLHALAGLLAIGHGEIVLDGRVLDGGPGGPFVAPDARGAGVVFQDHLLFPRMSVIDNVAYGLRCRGAGRRRAREEAAAWLKRVGLAERGDALPGSLSGGQAQRVALARALAVAPRMLLLDEPLSAVDASARLHLRRALRERLAAFPGVRLVVAHDIADALALADRLVVVEEGRIVQSGTIAELVGRPGSRYVADLVGLNCFRGTARGGIVELDGSRLVVAGEAQGPVTVTVHPRAVAVFRQRPEGSPRNVWEAPVRSVEPSLDRVRVQLGGPLPVVAEVTHEAVRALRLDQGGRVWVAIKATEISVAPS
jgi:molybdate transport system ATP-binding protein